MLATKVIETRGNRKERMRRKGKQLDMSLNEFNARRTAIER